MQDRQSPLDAAHRALGAKVVPFGGWAMPLSYPSGTLVEHEACRSSAVAFDVSHLGTVRVDGPDAFERLQAVLTNDLRKIGPGRAQYTHLLDPEDASVVDDIIVWWLPGGAGFDVMPNASNTERVVDAIGGIDTTASRAIIAIQGPLARARTAAAVPGLAEAAAVPHFGVIRTNWEGTPITVAGTGYTGEDGFEIAVPVEAATVLWDALVAEGSGIFPAGLGARDTLRLEAGLPLHGHELGAGITPLQAGLGWVVGWDKPGGFRGRNALAAEREQGIARRLRGLTTEGRQPPRQGYSVLVDGKPVGELTSGNFSPVLGHGIAMAFLPPTVGAGDGVEIDGRGRIVPARVVALPFVAKHRGV